MKGNKNCVDLQSPEVHLIQKESRACRGKRDVVGILKIKLLQKSWFTLCCVGDDGGDVSDGGDVEDSHDLPCNLSKSAKEMAQILPWSPP